MKASICFRCEWRQNWKGGRDGYLKSRWNIHEDSYVYTDRIAWIIVIFEFFSSKAARESINSGLVGLLRLTRDYAERSFSTAGTWIYYLGGYSDSSHSPTTARSSG